MTEYDTNDEIDHKMKCYDCGTIYQPLSKEGAIQLATEHCERFEHTRVHAEPAPDGGRISKQGMLPRDVTPDLPEEDKSE